MLSPVSTEFQEVVAKCKVIEDRVDPETEPYKSKYESREHMIALQQNLEPGNEKARLQCKLGINYYLTEENASAEKCLIDGVSNLEGADNWYKLQQAWSRSDFEVADQVPVPIGDAGLLADLVQAFNFLGILWSHRCDGSEDARGYLDRAKRIFEERLSNYDDLQDVFTNTLFYLAQVHTALGNHEIGASLCAETLFRQKKFLQDFDSCRWAKDAVGLSIFLGHKGRTRQASHCLNAALRTDDSPEVIADIKRGLGSLFLTMLENATVEFNKHDSWLTRESQLELRLSECLDDQYELDEFLPVAIEDIVDFEKARDVFKVANAAFEEGKQFYVLDGFVSDHVKILRSQSLLYKHLASYETDFRRRAAMHLRREKLLARLLDDLHPTLYNVEHQEISFELGEAAREQLSAHLEAAASQNDASKVNGTIVKLVKFFTHYIKAYEAAEGNKGEPEEAVLPYLSAHFWIAHSYSKMTVPNNSVEAKVTLLRQSRALFQKTLVLANTKLSESSPLFKTEKELCEEMVELLPSQIQHLEEK